MNELLNSDLHFVVSRTPKDVIELMKKHGLFIAGGFVRSTISGERPTDIDLFGTNKESLADAAKDLALNRRGRLHETDNAFTVLAPSRLPVQFITRWVFDDPVNIHESFDFTVCQAVVWWDDAASAWRSLIGERFYPDLAARRLYYTAPKREEAPGGSLMRVRKFLARGYNIQAASLAHVIARLMEGVHDSDLAHSNEDGLAQCILGVLHEVDPLIVVDGIDLVDEHEVLEGTEK